MAEIKPYTEAEIVDVFGVPLAKILERMAQLRDAMYVELERLPEGPIRDAARDKLVVPVERVLRTITDAYPPDLGERMKAGLTEDILALVGGVFTKAKMPVRVHRGSAAA